MRAGALAAFVPSLREPPNLSQLLERPLGPTAPLSLGLSRTPVPIVLGRLSGVVPAWALAPCGGEALREGP